MKADLRGLEAAPQPCFRAIVKFKAIPGPWGLGTAVAPPVMLRDEELKGMTLSQMIDRVAEATQNAGYGYLVDLPPPIPTVTWRGMTEAALNTHFQHLATGLTVSLRVSPYRMEFHIPAPHPAWVDFRWFFDEHDLLDQPLTLAGMEGELEQHIACWAEAGNRAEHLQYRADRCDRVEEARQALQDAVDEHVAQQAAMEGRRDAARQALTIAAQALEDGETPAAAEALRYWDAALRVLEGPRPAHQQAWTGGPCSP